MNIKNLKIIRYVVLALIILLAIAGVASTTFYMGRLAGALNPAWTAEKAMCVNQDVDIRQSPTGYVMSNVPAGEMVWFLKLELPFAHIAYYDGSTWLVGTVSAFVLEVCGQ